MPAYPGRERQHQQTAGGVRPGQGLGIDVEIRLLVQPDEVEGRRLELSAALVVGFEADGAGAAGDVLDCDRTDEVRRAQGGRGLDNRIGRDKPGAVVPDRPQKQVLD